MDRDSANRGVEIFPAAVVFTTFITIALMAAALFVSTDVYFVLLLSLFFLSVGFVLCVDASRVHDGEDVEASGGIASSHCQQLNQRHNGIRLPAIAMAQLRQLPVAEADHGADAAGGSDADKCVICLDNVGNDGLATRKLAACRHVFHEHCIDQWLRAHPLCPICRSNARQESLEVIVRLNT